LGASFKIAELLLRESSVVIPPKGTGFKSDTPEGKIDIVDASFHYPTKPDVQVLDNVTINIP